VPEFLRQPVSDLIDLVSRERVLACDVVRLLLRDALPGDVGFDGHFRRTRSLEDFDELRDLLLAFRRENVVGLGAAVHVMPGVGHVERPERPRQVVGLVPGQAPALTASGILLGVIGVLLAGRAVARLLFGVAPNDDATLVGVSALMGVVSVGPVGSRPVARRRSTQQSH
jgi:hypothetical protein